MIDGNEEIRLNDSKIRVADLAQRGNPGRTVCPGAAIWDLPKASRVYALDPTTRQHAWFPVTALLKTDNLKMLRLKMSSGKSITVQVGHRLPVYREGQLRLVEAQHTRHLCLPRIRSYARCYPEQDSVIAYGEVGKAREAAQFKLPLDYANGQWLGLLIGDGCVAADHHVLLYGVGPKAKNREKFVEITGSGRLPYSGRTSIIEFEAKSLSGSGRTAVRTVISDQPWFSRWVRAQIGDHALVKRIPEFCLNGPEAHLWGLFDGLVSADGSVSVSRAKSKPQLMVNFSTSSPQLVGSFAKLCERLTLSCSASPYKSKHSGRPAWIITISTRDLARAHCRRAVSFAHPVKNRRFQEWIGSVSLGGRGDQVPYPDELHRAFNRGYASEHGFRKNSGGKTDYGPFTVYKYQGHWHRETARRYLNAQAQPEMLQASALYEAIVADETISWEQVVEIEPLSGLSTGWTVVVPGPGTITLASGLVVSGGVDLEDSVEIEHEDENWRAT